MVATAGRAEYEYAALRSRRHSASWRAQSPVGPTARTNNLSIRARQDNLRLSSERSAPGEP